MGMRLQGAHVYFDIGNLGMRVMMNEAQMKEMVNAINTKNYDKTVSRHSPYEIPQMNMVRGFYGDDEIRDFYNTAIRKKVKRK